MDRIIEKLRGKLIYVISNVCGFKLWGDKGE